MGKKSGHKKTKQIQQQKPAAASVRRPGLSLASLSGEAAVAPVQFAQPRVMPKISSLDEQTAYIRGDILRILLLLTIAALVLAVLSAINFKTPVLKNAGHRVTSFMKLQ